MEYVVGERVKVRTQTGRVIEKIVYGHTPSSPLVCTPEEFETARQEEREPRGSGWPADDILGRA